MNGPARLRSLVDQLNKAAARRPNMPSGGPRRMLEEAINTGANARGLAQLSTQKAEQPGEVEPLAELIRKLRKRY